jgi:hypothetical protein
MGPLQNVPQNASLDNISSAGMRGGPCTDMLLGEVKDANGCLQANIGNEICDICNGPVLLYFCLRTDIGKLLIKPLSVCL